MGGTCSSDRSALLGWRRGSAPKHFLSRANTQKIAQSSIVITFDFALFLSIRCIYLGEYDRLMGLGIQL